MFDLSLFFLAQSIFLLMMLFWLLSWIGDRFYKTKDYKASENVYECGFASTHSLRVSINFGFFIIAMLLILYDIEFLLLIPVYFNSANLNIMSSSIYWVFFIFMSISFLVDWESIALKWIL